MFLLLLIVLLCAAGGSGKAEMTGTARSRMAMPSQRGSQRRAVMVAEARAGPSWSEKMDDTALT
jgi:hypothetical protein